MQKYNVHTHIFTMNNAPRKFLQLYMPAWAADAIDTITNTQAGSKITQGILSILPWKPGKRYASFLRIGKSKNQLEVFQDLFSQYDDDSMKFVTLALYMEKLGADTSVSGYEGQLEEVIAIKKQYPDKILPFLCIDTRWLADGATLRNTVEKYFNTPIAINGTRKVYPFAGIKVYPSTGFYIFDEKLQPTLEWAADNDVPVLSHCNYMGGIYNNDENYIKANLNTPDAYTGRRYAAAYYPNAGNQENCSYYLEPESYRTVLQYFKKRSETEGKKDLKLCLAHLGGDDHIVAELGSKKIDETKLYGMKKRNWCGQILELMNKFPNLYTDISYAISNPDIHEPIIEQLKGSAHQNRIMFGTDFFLTERVMPERTDYTTFREKAMKEFADTGKTITCWDQIASLSTESFLNSRYLHDYTI